MELFCSADTFDMETMQQKTVLLRVRNDESCQVLSSTTKIPPDRRVLDIPGVKFVAVLDFRHIALSRRRDGATHTTFTYDVGSDLAFIVSLLICDLRLILSRPYQWINRSIAFEYGKDEAQ
ncbi:hypothetical protein J6590_021482 [Homalodisca vitripennis]|nr:hypothetical protein J6590_021482 [Homalodisca vitripennis]